MGHLKAAAWHEASKASMPTPKPFEEKLTLMKNQDPYESIDSTSFEKMTTKAYLSKWTPDDVLTGYLDSGCNRWMVKDISAMDRKTSRPTTTIVGCAGAGQSIKAALIGNIKLIDKSGRVIVVEDALYVPGAKHNLFSVGMFDNAGMKVAFEGRMTTITRTLKSGVKEVVASQARDERSELYPISFVKCPNENLSLFFAERGALKSKG